MGNLITVEVLDENGDPVADGPASVDGLLQRLACKLLKSRWIAVPYPANNQPGRARSLRGAPKNEMRLTTSKDVTHGFLLLRIGWRRLPLASLARFRDHW
jgi:hypothetical protein